VNDAPVRPPAKEIPTRRRERGNVSRSKGALAADAIW
jgi:hypothetical protein